MNGIKVTVPIGVNGKEFMDREARRRAVSMEQVAYELMECGYDNYLKTHPIALIVVDEETP